MTESSLSPVVQKLHKYVQQGPTEFEITILPNVSTNKLETDELSLDESLVLMEGQFLGREARSLPWMTHTIRKDYKALKKTLMATTAATSDDQSSTNNSTNNAPVHALHSQILMATDALMLVNPDHSTAWGDRRRALIATSGDWTREMQFLNLMMTQHSKAPSSWGHRKYVLQQIVEGIVKETDNNETTLVDLVHKEIAHCSKIAEKFPKNYYAWTHRRYLWSSCILPHLQSNNEIFQTLLQKEFDALKAWLEQHISDHSAVHYLTQVLEIQLRSMQKDESQSLAVSKKSLDLSQSLLSTHSDHESLWILRRLIVQLLHQHAQTISESGRAPILLLVENLVNEVWDRLQSSENGYTGTTKVYAWSFLVRCMSQLGLGCGQSQTKLQDGLGFLQSDSHVYHKMWKTHGEELLLTGK
jgi:protein prenyltransferase alpha subunit repeat containing protein 1